MRFRNIAFSVAMGMFLAGPAALGLCHLLGMESIPPWLSSEEASYLEGGKSPVDFSGDLAGEFVTGKLQVNLENCVSNNIPGKGAALLGDAAVQRVAIILSNMAFSWPCYSTFYGSERFYVPSSDSLIQSARCDRQSRAKGVRSFAEGLARVAQANPNRRFAVILADISPRSQTNPTVPLVSESYLTFEALEDIRQVVAGIDNVCIEARLYDDQSEYYEYYYHSDHHWNGWGALDSYRAISNEFGLAGLEKFYRADAAMGNVFMNGSYARSGLMMLDEAVNEPSVSLENLTIVSGNAPALATPDPRRYITDKALSAEFDWYHFWYGPSSELVLEGGGASGFSRALIIGDSFTSAIQWPIAQNYYRTSVFIDAHDSSRGKIRLQERIDQTNCEDIYIVASLDGLRNLEDNHPGYFG